MSYCVNCGVKLKQSEKVCPLCNTKVINPNNLKDKFTPAYSQAVEKHKEINKKALSWCELCISRVLFFYLLNLWAILIREYSAEFLLFSVQIFLFC